MVLPAWCGLGLLSEQARRVLTCWPGPSPSAHEASALRSHTQLGSDGAPLASTEPSGGAAATQAP